MVDMEAGRAGHLAEQSRGHTPDIMRQTADTEFHQISQGGDSDRSNSDRSSSDRSLIRRPELSEIDLGEPFSEQIVRRRDSQPSGSRDPQPSGGRESRQLGRRDSHMEGNRDRDTDKEPVSTLRSPPVSKAEEQHAPKSRESRAAAQAPMIDIAEDQQSVWELSATERSSEEYGVDRGVSIPMMDDFFTPWSGPGPSSAFADASPIEYSNASIVNRYPSQPLPALESPVQHPESTVPRIRLSRSQEREVPVEETPHENRIRSGSTSGRMQLYANSATSSQSQLTASRRPLNVEKPLPALPGQARPSRYQQV